MTGLDYGRGKENELRAWAADPAPEVRFAAAICFSGYYYGRFKDAILDVLRWDGCAAVRAAAWLTSSEVRSSGVA